MKNLKGTETEKNLQTAYEGECKATNKYAYYAAKAREENYQQIADVFEATSIHEREHAKLWFKALHEGEVPATLINLIDAVESENFECSEMYKEFSEKAAIEGFEEIAMNFAAVANIEKSHEERYSALLANLKTGKVFKFPKPTWICDFCGHSTKNKDTPETCPVCLHPNYQECYRLLKKNIEDKASGTSSKQVWICMSCTYLHDKETAPNFCPLCGHPLEYFKKRTVTF